MTTSPSSPRDAGRYRERLFDRLGHADPLDVRARTADRLAEIVLAGHDLSHLHQIVVRCLRSAREGR